MIKNKWKTIAIVFICLFVVETLLFTWIFNVGLKAIEKEDECSINVCGDYDAFFYDIYTSICYCYEDDEIVHQRLMT